MTALKNNNERRRDDSGEGFTHQIIYFPSKILQTDHNKLKMMFK